MLVIYRENQVLTGLIGARPEDLEAHIRAGYPELAADYDAGTLQWVEIDDAPYDPLALVVDKGAVRPLSRDEQEARTAAVPDPALEARIAAEMRLMAIERLKSRGQIPEGYR